MSELSPVLFKSLGLPYEKGEKLRAGYNPLTKKVDGNTDSNRDGKIDEKDKNGFVEPEELFEEVFSNRDSYRYQLVIEKLYAAGLEDPFEENPKVKNHVEKLFKKHEPRIVLETELDKAICLF